MSDTLSRRVVIVSVPGMKLENEKSRRDAHPAVKAAHVAVQRTAANNAVTSALGGLGCSQSITWTSKNGRLVRFVSSPPPSWGVATFEGFRVLMERLAPVPLTDTGDSLPSSFTNVRDGIAEALGLDDAELLGAFGADGEVVRKPCALVWTCEQRRGPWGVRITIGA